MKQLIIIVALIALTPFSVMANEWSGSQYQLTSGISKKQTENVTSKITFTYFGCHKSNTNQYWLYGGPEWSKGDLWIHPNIGTVLGWQGFSDKPFAILALWAGNSLYGVDLSIDCESINGKQFDYYGYYAANRSFGLVNGGLHLEEVNKAFQWGPDIGCKYGRVALLLRYFTGGGNHAVRLFVQLR
ncbi:MAG: hypothetical protein V1897_15545 [Pseudomonadota bacterium]